ncbi:MAG: HEAT repeat domain-containing protein [Deltaproteobacteria bacterium]|nr:HEAT repeat domain-containing protein [Deltaproteobacteria bacterium]MBW2307134.1 HEAT repeat domain-containing protein [Deltaproteobacteria bacterium]
MNTEIWMGRNLSSRVFCLLKLTDFNNTLNELSRLPARRVIRSLFSFLCYNDQTTRWRSITAMGLVVAQLAERDMESARVVMRRLMWSLNDESGGIGWGAPEAMGEIMAHHEGLAKEYAHLLVSYIRQDGNFLEYELLQRGVAWGLGRLAQVRPCLVKDAADHIDRYLRSRDAGVRGLAAWAAGFLGAEEVGSELEGLLHDRSEVLLYMDRKLVVLSVGDLAQQALAALEKKVPGEAITNR